MIRLLTKSFDATSLYLYVPVKAAMNKAEKKLYSRKYALSLVDKETFIILA